ncbi:hypothetical protein [Arsenicibacter rosenii]|uniref:Ig-like domain-containing protein n=1 Tax=Arsenicibacter rosenii TaxID=1750698 RepID=A0A1S2VEM5_9BACT|nr:hypothetical protein [Arsenicibacter rosenii]OIN56646.1 hypothetical protein BLX24_23745 [Arsenicibacter rosenii]
MHNVFKIAGIFLLMFLSGQVFSQRKPVSATITTGTGDPVTSYTACTSTLLALQADCDGDRVDWSGDNGFFEPQDASILVPVTAGAVSYTVICYYNDGGRYEGDPTTFTLVGSSEGCPQPCNVTPTASNLQTVGTLGGDKCSIQLSAQVSGRHFEFTGPNGYVYSVIYRNCQENITIFAENVKEPGTYTLKIYSEEIPQGPTPGRRAAGGGQFYTIEVGGTACPTR